LNYGEYLNRPNSELIANRNNIFYQTLAQNSLTGVENLIYLDEINELSVLKNITTRISNNEKTCLINDIFIFLNQQNEIKNNFIENKFDLCEWLDQKGETNSNLIFIKNKSFNEITQKNSNTNNNLNNSNYFQYNTLIEIMKYKNYDLVIKYKDFFSKIFDFLQIFNMNLFMFFNFSEKYDNYTNIKFLPIFPTQLFLNNLKTNFILDTQLISKKNEFSSIKKSEFQKIISFLDLENSFPQKYAKFFQELSIIVLDKYFYLLEIILNLLKNINLIHIFRNIFYLLVLSHIFMNFKSIFEKAKTQSKNIFEEINRRISFLNFENNELFIFYSNLIVIFIYVFTFDLISMRFQENLDAKIFKNNQKNISFTNIGLLLLGNNNPLNKNNIDGDIILFEDLIFNKIINTGNNDRIDNELSNSQTLITKYLLYHFNENLSNFNKSVNISNQGELNIILFFEKIFDMKIFFDFYKINSEVYDNNNSIRGVELLRVSLKNHIHNFEQMENKNSQIKQIWSFEFENFNNFFTKEENVIDILQNNKIIDFIKYYKMQESSYFSEYPMNKFFQKFLPILEDIDTVYDKEKNYEEVLTYFFKDLQNFEEYKEKFEISRNFVKFNFITYSILTKLIKNIKEEKAQMVQKHYKRKMIYDFIRYFRSQVLKIQKNWKEYYFNKMSECDYEKCVMYIAGKYKNRDPILLKIFRNLYNNSQNLTSENGKLKQELNSYKKENQTLQFNISELQKRLKKNQEQTNSLSSSTHSLFSMENLNKHNKNSSNVSYASNKKKNSNLNLNMSSSINKGNTNNTNNANIIKTTTYDDTNGEVKY
jgi:hypothetical protein